MSPTTRVLVGLAAGVLAGVVISASGNGALQSVATAIEQVGILWINAIRMTVIPLVVSLLFVSMTGFTDLRSAGRLGGRTMFVFMAFLIGSALCAALIVPVVFEWMPAAASVQATPGLAPGASSVQEQAQQLPSVAQWFVELIPINPLRAAADGAMLPLVIFTVLFGLASTTIAPDLKDALVRFFTAVSEAMLTLVRWLVVLAPLGVFALILPMAARTGTSIVGAFAFYVIAVSGLLCVLILALYPIAAALGRVSARQFAEAAFPAQVIAFSSQSSLASLPGLLEGADKKLNCPQVTGFVLPLAVSLFKITTPVVWLAGACFVAQLYAVSLEATDIVLILVASIVLSFGAPGVPMGSLILLAPVFASAGLPVEGIGVLMAIDYVPDIFKTVLNVTGDMAAATVLSRQHR